MNKAEVVAAIVQLMLAWAGPSLAVRSKRAWSPAIVSAKRTAFGSPVRGSWSIQSSVV